MQAVILWYRLPIFETVLPQNHDYRSIRRLIHWIPYQFAAHSGEFFAFKQCEDNGLASCVGKLPFADGYLHFAPPFVRFSSRSTVCLDPSRLPVPTSRPSAMTRRRPGRHRHVLPVGTVTCCPSFLTLHRPSVLSQGYKWFRGRIAVDILSTVVTSSGCPNVRPELQSGGHGPRHRADPHLLRLIPGTTIPSNVVYTYH